MNQTLAIVIPAFRAKFLSIALDSLASQTDQDFNIYVGDDFSPDDLLAIVREYSSRFRNLRYQRFEQNLGGSDLISHWARCIRLSGQEDWIWLFSDDDVAEPNCVADFRRAVTSSPGVDLFHFNIDLINERGERYERPKPHPLYETAVDHSLAIITDRRRQWRAPDHVFSRRVYEAQQGFVPFSRALYSDFATWVKFSHPGGVGTIGPSRVLWRSHGMGTSSGQRGNNRVHMLSALCAYADWLYNFSKAHNPLLTPKLARHLPGYVYRELALISPPLSFRENAEISSRLASTFGTTWAWQFFALELASLRGYVRKWPIINKIALARYRRYRAESTIPGKVSS